MTTPPSTPRAGRAQTVLGLVAPESLGLTLPHEHLFVDLGFLYREPPAGGARGHEREAIELSNLYEINYDWFSSRENLRLTDEATAIEEAGIFRRDGGQTLVDPTTAGIGRNPRPSSASPGRPGSTSSWARATTRSRPTRPGWRRRPRTPWCARSSATSSTASGTPACGRG